MLRKPQKKSFLNGRANGTGGGSKGPAIQEKKNFYFFKKKVPTAIMLEGGG